MTLLRSPAGSRILKVAGAVVVLVVLGAAVWAWVHVPQLYPLPAPSGDRTVDATDRATRAQSIVTTRASVLAALAGLGALVTIAINFRNSRTAAATLATTNETFRITARGHLTDRYTKAIEQLGNDNLAIRLGGIYALQQFAVETDRDEDQRTVVEVLSAFVRTSLPRAAAARPPQPAPQEGRRDATEPDLDVQAAMSALSRLPDRIYLRADFTGTDFSGLDLTDVDLHGAHLARAAFRDARLDVAVLSGAYLDGADLSGADLSRADLSRAVLRGADLSRADLSRAVLGDAVLRDADLSGADLRSAFLGGADLSGAVVRGAVLSDAVFNGADLSPSVLRAVHLSDEQRAAAHSVRDRPASDGGG